MHFRSIADLNLQILQSLYRIPNDIDVVVAIPRSGVLPATLISTTLDLPLADVEGVAAGRLLSTGNNGDHAGVEPKPFAPKHVLLVDDSVDTGTSMRAARQFLDAALPKTKITSLTVFAVGDSSQGADIALSVVERPRVFEWNVMHHKILEFACVTIEGVLAAEPESPLHDQGPSDLPPVANCTALYRSTRRIHAVVTSRSEKDRKETEAWLAESGIRYQHLVMSPEGGKGTENGWHAAFKAAYYRSSEARLFIEGKRSVADEISIQSKKPVLWLPGATMFYHDGTSPKKRAVLRRGSRAVTEIARRFMGNAAYTKLKSVLSP